LVLVAGPARANRCGGGQSRKDETMTKLLSRKLGVTIATILAVVLQVDDPVRAAVAGAVAIAYVIAQAFVDKTEVERVATALEEGLDLAREHSGEDG
jgi:hypothetical protein